MVLGCLHQRWTVRDFVLCLNKVHKYSSKQSEVYTVERNTYSGYLFFGGQRTSSWEMLCTWDKSPQKLLPCLWNVYPTLMTAAYSPQWCSLNRPWWRTGIQPSLINVFLFFMNASRALSFLHFTVHRKELLYSFITSQWQKSHWCQSVHSMSETKPASVRSLREQNQHSTNNKTLPSTKLCTHSHTSYHGVRAS